MGARRDGTGYSEILLGTLMTCDADKGPRQLGYDCSPSVQSHSIFSQRRDIDGGSSADFSGKNLRDQYYDAPGTNCLSLSG